jgi:integron integrase
METVVMEDIPPILPAQPVRFLDQLRAFIRLDGKTFATEKTYVYWTKHFIRFHKRRHPRELGVLEVEAYLSYLALQGNVSPSTQKIALNALVFLYNRFLNLPLDGLSFNYARKPARVPTVFTHDEAMRVIGLLSEPYSLMAGLMYGAGLRISEAARLRVKDLDFAMGYIVVRNGKGDKDRTTLLPKSLVEALQQQVKVVKQLRELDSAQGVGSVWLPHQLERKYPHLGRSLGWQYVFPSAELSEDPRSNDVMRRHHIHRASVQRAVKVAVRKAGIHKQASCHTFRHSFATRLLQARYDLKQIQNLMGHSDIRTTEIYLHVLDELGNRVESPLDAVPA